MTTPQTIEHRIPGLNERGEIIVDLSTLRASAATIHKS